MRLWNFLESTFGVRIATVPTSEDSLVDLEELDRQLDQSTKLISFSHVTFDTGEIITAEDIGKIAREHSVPFMLDGAQSVGATKVDVKKIGCDFYAIAGQKALGAGQGTGALYLRKDAGEGLDPLIVGDPYTSSLVLGLPKLEVAQTKSPDGGNRSPYKFEPTSQNYPGIVGLCSAANYFFSLEPDRAAEWIEGLVKRALSQLQEMRGIEIVGSTEPKDRIFVSFRVTGRTNQDVTAMLQQKHIIVRALARCVRACFHWTNDENDLQRLISGVTELTH